MIPAEKIPVALQEAPFSITQAEQLGLSRHFLREMLRTGQIEKLARGIYRLCQPDYSEEDQFRAALLRVDKPSTICLISALSFHHLTDLIPNKIWIFVPQMKRTTYKDLKLIRISHPHWKTGIKTGDGYRITSLERTLVDAFTYKRYVGLETAVNALRKAIREQRTTTAKVLEMSISLDADARIRPYIEALS
jgi:predicted transcriptional regulator of viral defense system